MALVHDARPKIAASLLDALPDAVLVVGGDQLVVYANPACVRMFGYEGDELLGTRVDMLLPDGLPASDGPALRGCTKDGRDLLLDASVGMMEGRRREPLTVLDLREPDAGAAHRRGEAAFRAVLEGLPDAVVATRPDGSIVFANDRAAELFGYTAAELVDTPVERLWPERLRARYARNVGQLWGQGRGLRYTREVRGLRRDASEFPGEMAWGVVQADSGPLLIAVGRDISDRLLADQKLRRYTAERSVVASLGERALAGADPLELAAQVADAVGRTLEIGMVQVLEVVPGTGSALRTMAGWSHTADPSGALAAAAARHAQAALGARGATSFATADIAEDAPEGDVALAGVRSGMAVAIRTGDEDFGVLAAYAWREDAFGEGDGAFLQVVANVLATAMARRRMELRLRHQALHDPLTGLANRTLCDDRLRQAVARARRSRAGIAVLYIDLNGFKAVNDQHGHAAGDEALTMFAKRLSDSVRPSDTVGRIGGDEFLVICEDMDRESALRLGNRLADTARESIRAGDAEHRLGASVGIALTTGDPPDPITLVRAADGASYRAKRGDDDVKLVNPDRWDLPL